MIPNINNKIEAFTIVELIIAMVISTVVITLGVGLYLNTQNYFASMVNKYSNDSELILFQSVFAKDFNEAVLVEAYGIQIELGGADGKEIYYDFEDEYILREKEYTIDTFFLFVEDMEFSFFQGSSSIIEHLSFYILGEKNSQEVFLQKKYTKDILYELTYKNN